MPATSPKSNPDPLLGVLAEFRYELRRFLHFSECAALKAGLHPQQHQLMLQVAGAPAGTAVTIAYAAARLGLKHNSAVELADRCEREGLLTRTTDAADKRCAILTISRMGGQILSRLSRDHARELNEQAPLLARALERIQEHSRRRPGRASR